MFDSIILIFYYKKDHNPFFFFTGSLFCVCAHVRAIHFLPQYASSVTTMVQH